ncbi:MAG: hypothetical protein ACTSU6_04925, partial [Candidatus Njordarchaeales archaeon]
MKGINPIIATVLLLSITLIISASVTVIYVKFVEKVYPCEFVCKHLTKVKKINNTNILELYDTLSVAEDYIQSHKNYISISYEGKVIHPYGVYSKTNKPISCP